MGNEFIEEPHERAFVESVGGHELQGQSLRTYSPSRRVAANAMGMLYPMIGDESAAQMAQTGVYPGVIRDVATVLWLCSLPDGDEITAQQFREGQWTPSRALAKPYAALEVAIEWAGAKGLTITDSQEFVEALTVFGKIVTNAESSRFIVKSDEPGKAGDGGPKV